MPFASDRDRGAHLLRRFGLGASEAELDYYLQDGLPGFVDKLLDPPEDPGSVVDVDLLRNDKGNLPMPQVVNAWTLRMLMTRRPLEERMTLFWHNHFATSASKVAQSPLMVQQVDTLRKNALAPFPRLLDAVSKDPAMLFWLDNQENVRGKPNENFAREVMELFTLGIGHYTERDVQEGARAFTGWAFRRGGGKAGGAGPRFLYRPAQHDDGSKTFLGQTGPFNGDDVLRILCAQPRTAEFLVAKLWDWFVWPDPDPKTIAPFAARYRASGMDTKALLRDIMRSDEFYSDKAVRAIVKSPVDVVIVTMRQLGVGETLRNADAAQVAGSKAALQPAYTAQLAMKAMGQWLLYPPDVSGWKNGKAWISSATMTERIAWGERLFGQGQAKGRAPLRYPAFGLLVDATTPDAIVHKLASVFDVRLAPARRALLVSAAAKVSEGAVTAANAGKVAATVSHLMFASPEFQFC